MYRIRVLLVPASCLLLLQACAAYVASSGRVAVKNDSPPPTAAQKPATPPSVLAPTRPATRDVRVALVAGFSTRDRLIIEEFFEKKRATPTRRDVLPSGFSAQDRLPVAIQGQPLPRPLESKLTVLPDAYIRLLVGRDVLLLERDSRVVLDLLRDVMSE